MTLTFEDAVHIARPQIVAAGDTARTRTTDPTTSHMAGDTSAATIGLTKVGVLSVVRDNPDITGTHLNDQYMFAQSRHSWMPKVVWDSPRRRAGELVREGLLEASELPERGRNNQPEHTYRLTAAGARRIAPGFRAVSDA